jgi:glyoxylate reductase
VPPEAPQRPRFAVLRRIPEPALDLLGAAGDLQDAIAGADAALTLLYDRVDDALLDAAGPQLRCIANVAVGYDNVDVAACTARGVLVTNTPGVLTDATADLTIALMLSVTRRLGEGERLVRAGAPWSFDMFFMLGTGLAGKTLGVIGLGAIGQATARRARAFGMEVVYAGHHRVAEAVERELGGARFMSLDELLSSADVVTIHCPMTPETHHLIDAARLAQMRRTAFLVNTARGPIVDELALAAALHDGLIAGAALDVFEAEPNVHPDLLALDNVALSPHLGSATVETRTAMAVLAARNAIAAVRGEPPPTPVNPEVLPLALP